MCYGLEPALGVRAKFYGFSSGSVQHFALRTTTLLKGPAPLAS